MPTAFTARAPFPHREAGPFRPDIVILGDGLGGLACAYYALRAGRTPIVVSAPEPGRERLAWLDHDKLRIDAFHTPIRTQDTALLGLLHDLGLHGQIQWRQVYGRSRVARPASWASRLRAGAAEAIACREYRYARHRQYRSAESLRSLAGNRAFEERLRPRIESVLGELDVETPLFAASRALSETAAIGSERLGSVNGGWGRVAAALRAHVVRHGGQIWDAPELPRIRLQRGGVELTGRRTIRVASAVSLLWERDLALLVDGVAARTDGRARDVLSIGFAGRRLDLGTYRCAGFDAAGRFHDFVQADRLLPLRETRGLRLIYTERRIPAATPHEPADVLIKQALDQLQSLVPSIEPEAVEHTWVARGSAAERLPRVGESPTPHVQRMHDGALYVASCRQAQPRRWDFETSIQMAREVICHALRDGL